MRVTTTVCRRRSTVLVLAIGSKEETVLVYALTHNPVSRQFPLYIGFWSKWPRVGRLSALFRSAGVVVPLTRKVVGLGA